MILSIISNGPSGLEASPDAGSIVAGVNGAPCRHRCHWWVFCDVATYVDHRSKILMAPDGLPPTIFARLSSVVGVTDPCGHTWRRGERVLYHEDIRPPVAMTNPPPGDRRWNQWSGLAALGLAWHLRPDQLHLYGFDLAGDTGLLGEKNDSRGGDRWQVERRMVDRWIGELRSVGIKIRWRAGGVVEC